MGSPFGRVIRVPGLGVGVGVRVRGVVLAIDGRLGLGGWVRISTAIRNWVETGVEDCR